MKSSRIWIVVIIVVLLLPVLGHLLWMVQKKKPLNLMIVNKSVPTTSHNEVKSFNWVLNYEKVLKAGNEHYDFSKDYYGFHPEAVTEERTIKSYRLEDFPTIRKDYDGIVYLDNQGVELDGQKFSSITYYGGFNQTDYLLMREMMSSGKLVIAEFNFFSDPTEELVRYNTEQMMDIYSLRWKGKFFKNLEKKKIQEEVDPKWFESYSESYNKEWDYSGPGLILCNEKQQRVVVIPADKYMTEKFPTIESLATASDQYGLPDQAAYTGWFEVVHEGNNEVISQINLNLNEEGEELLKMNGLESTFPACIKVPEKPVYFMAGDFSKQNVVMAWSRLRIFSDICRGVCKGMTKNPNRFFQTYYVPLISNILDNYHSTNGIKEKS
jgi:hypothetical protein